MNTNAHTVLARVIQTVANLITMAISMLLSGFCINGELAFFKCPAIANM
jgi:hypothetical protein